MLNGDHVDNHYELDDNGDQSLIMMMVTKTTTMMVIMIVIMALIKTSLIVISDSQMCLDLPWKAILYRAVSIKLTNVKYLLDKLQVAPVPHLFDHGSWFLP